MILTKHIVKKQRAFLFESNPPISNSSETIESTAGALLDGKDGH